MVHKSSSQIVRYNCYKPCNSNCIFSCFSETVVMIPTQAVQHLEEYWPEPYKFDPDRFTPGKKIESFTYFPFTAGPRICIGRHFAIMEAKLVLAKLYHTFQFYDPYPETMELEKTVSLTAKPKNGVFVGIAN